MYELTISIFYNRSNIIEQIATELENEIKLSDGLMVCGLFDGRAQLSLAVKQSKKDFIKAKILCVVSDALVSNYKYEYLNEHIYENLIKEKDRNSLIRALTEFDKTTDVDLVKKNLVFNNQIVLDSLYNFRLQELKNRWKDIVELVNNNLPNLVASDTLCDMMKFLIASSPVKTDEVYIGENSDLIYLIDNLKNARLNFKWERSDNEVEQKLINQLIKLSPRRIYISKDVYGKIEFMKKIESLFDGRVYITH